MGVTLKWANLAERIGSGIFDFQDRVAEETRKFACRLWQSFPSSISLNTTVAENLTRGYMSRVCRDQPLPVVQPAPFTGGQCENVEYDVTTYSFFYNVDNCQFSEKTTTRRVFGPVRGLQKNIVEFNATTTDCNGLMDAPANRIDWELLSGTPNVFISGSNFDAEGANPPLTFAEIINIVRVDGLPDDCGDPEPGYPYVEPKDPTGFTDSVTINIEDGDDLTLNFFYDNSLQSFPMNITVNGISTSLDFNGITFNYSPSGDDGEAGTLPDGQPNPLPAPPDDINLKLPKPFVKPPNDEDYDTEEFSETDPTEQEVGTELEFVQVQLTTLPSQGKTQFGEGGPNVYYAGWFEFRVGGFNFPRQPINFQNNIFAKPLGATGYALTFTNGANGTHKIFKLKIEEE